MNAAALLLLVVGAVIAMAVFAVMRFPGARREQFRQHPAFSLWVSTVASVAVLGVFVFLALMHT